MKESSSMPVEQTYLASMGSCVKIWTPKKNYILVSKTTVEKQEKEPVSKVWVGLAPPPNLKAVRPSVGSGSNTR
jgi:hypothetical protein